MFPFPLILSYSIDCTYSHFERSSNCPACGAVLNESDFTELVVADSTSTGETVKTSLQALFTKKTSSSSLPFSDLCYSLIRQIDAQKISTKFLLKQFLMDANLNTQVIRTCESLKQEITQLKQTNSTQRLQFERITADLNNKLQAREAVIQEMQNKSRGGNVIPRSSNSNAAPPSRLGQSRMPHSLPRQEKPAFQEFMQQKEAKERAQQQALQAQRAPSVLGRAAQSHQPGKRSHSYGTESARPSSHGQTNITPIQQMGSRPFSSNSAGSIPGTPRIRDLSSSSGYRFISGSNGAQWQGNNQHVNKRRRGTPSSTGGGGGIPSVHRGMSPSTAFTLNNGHHSRRSGPNQYFTQG